ncbi:hypothetical protein RFI_06932 [Reticulomyxa filosa]|uniref:Uncharacterized protein n=1 Tax=Reticulomyxa filosa TaxID=46433 RepID=X6NW08_RETFI|nr:hypothetical protein RFI_06932 [Reticulomyxa filosa]|eukprot:ETO30191.1 hypothetical protein RFI_06932 [Reticulomyxa filosa]
MFTKKKKKEEIKVLKTNKKMFGTLIFWASTATTGIFGYLISLASYLQIGYTSPLSHCISATAKTAIQIIIIFTFFENYVTMHVVIGTAIINVDIWNAQRKRRKFFNSSSSPVLVSYSTPDPSNNCSLDKTVVKKKQHWQSNKN